MSFKKSTGLPLLHQLLDSSRNQRPKSRRNGLRETRQDPPWLPGVENEFALPQAAHRSWKAWEVVVRKGCWSMCNSRCPKMQTCKRQEFVSFQGNDHLNERFAGLLLPFPSSSQRKCFKNQQMFPFRREICIYHLMSTVLVYDVYQNPQRILLLSGCSYSYMRMPLLLIPICSQRKKTCL